MEVMVDEELMEMTGGEFLTKDFSNFRESPRSFLLGFTFPVLRRLFAGIESSAIILLLESR